MEGCQAERESGVFREGRDVFLCERAMGCSKGGEKEEDEEGRERDGRDLNAGRSEIGDRKVGMRKASVVDCAWEAARHCALELQVWNQMFSLRNVQEGEKEYLDFKLLGES